MLDYITNAKNVEKYTKSIDGLIKSFCVYINFAMAILINFVLLLRNGVYLYEYMNSWERFDETLLPNKKAFYSELNLEDISDKDYEHAKKVWEVFEIKNLGAYHDLYVQNDILLPADVFENFRDKVLKYMKLILLIFCLHQD